MDKQFRLYSVDTKAFYTEEENDLNNLKMEIIKAMKTYEEWMDFTIKYKCPDMGYEQYWDLKNEFIKLNSKKELSLEDEVRLKELKGIFRPAKKKNKDKNETNKEQKEYMTYQEIQKEKDISNRIKSKKSKSELKANNDYCTLKNELSKINKSMSSLFIKTRHRILDSRKLNISDQISLFDNSLSRIENLKHNDMFEDMIIVRVYHYVILEQLIKNGFTYIDKEGNKIRYRVFTASAGQIRTKKVIFVNEEMWKKNERTLMCGLTIDKINKKGGCNVNKFLAYLALCNSATDEILNFDIDQAIVIDDFETIVTDKVDYIDNKTFEVTRQSMEVPIPHSDGCGWVNPEISSKNFMIRLPWVKGLVTPVNYIEFCNEYRNGKYKIKDIYGKEWNLKKDNINYVFSKSQFKMYKYYNSWDEYKHYFKKYNCKANMCNLEPDTNKFKKACFNYQMWQTLTDVKDEEIKYFTDKVDDFITKGYSNKDTMLQILGADKSNFNKNWLQKCIEIYPEMIREYHIKEELASSLNARKKEAKYGKFKINATYTFLLPDVFAWMQYVFLNNGKENYIPKGLLENNEVSCKLYKKSYELLVNRSPHLYREHAVRDNVINNNTEKWFLTDGVYTSTKDLISKVLQFDNDGDKGLVISEPILIDIVKRNMKNIVPLYYEMGKAEAIEINKDNIYDSLTKAFKYNNIGKFSNQLTVMWNLNDIDIITIAQITALNNFTIDAAKTLLVPEVPNDIKNKMKVANGKMPYFFKFAKDKGNNEVESINNSTMNRICKNIENIRQNQYNFNELGSFKRVIMMNNFKIEIKDEIVDKYLELDNKRKAQVVSAKINNIDYKEYSVAIHNSIKGEFLDYCDSIEINIVDATDMLIRYIYTNNKNSKKGFLFELLGEIIFNNIKNNLKNYTRCEDCGELVKKTNSKTKRCKDCAKIIDNKKRSQRKR